MTMSRKLAEVKEHHCDIDAVTEITTDDASSSKTMITDFISNPSKKSKKLQVCNYILTELISSTIMQIGIKGQKTAIQEQLNSIGELTKLTNDSNGLNRVLSMLTQASAALETIASSRLRQGIKCYNL